MIPITIITGFLGAGKTTLINKIIKENDTTKFGLIINEFGEIGVDSELLSSQERSTKEEIIEMSNGCLCCVVRSDLIEAVKKMVETKKINHIIIETSGLAEPAPIVQTFLTNDLDGSIILDSVICVVDAENFDKNIKDYKTLTEQLTNSDIVVINKIDEKNIDFNKQLNSLINNLNPYLSILENSNSFSSKILIDTNKDLEQNLNLKLKQENHDHHDHNHKHEDHGHHNHTNGHIHEHEEFSEVLYTTRKQLDPTKLDQIFLKEIPKNIIRAKGFLVLESKLFLFQMVGANKSLTPYKLCGDSKLDEDMSYLIMIGKDLDRESILELLKKCEK